MPSIIFTVTNDLVYDQRMRRICNSLDNAGYAVTLVGRKLKQSINLRNESFKQKRIKCYFEKGKLFYIEFNIRLFFYLLRKKTDAICAIDLDTIIPCYLISRIKRVKRIYDAHELFCEMKEIVERPFIYKFWKFIERKTVPKFKNGYTVNELIAKEFEKLYNVRYDVIRSIALYDSAKREDVKEKFILYQGAVNEGRSFETLIPSMQWVDAKLIICGDGNFMKQAQKLVRKYQLAEKVVFKGMVPPEELRSFTQRSYIGITIFEKDALSNYYSLANRFFDYIQSGTPQLCVDYPVYRELNNIYNVGVLIDDISAENIAANLNKLLIDENLWQEIHQNCKTARKELNWQKEEEKLLSFYKRIFG